jgi:hypothetical protein
MSFARGFFYSLVYSATRENSNPLLLIEKMSAWSNFGPEMVYSILKHWNICS